PPDDQRALSPLAGPRASEIVARACTYSPGPPYSKYVVDHAPRPAIGPLGVELAHGSGTPELLHLEPELERTDAPDGGASVELEHQIGAGHVARHPRLHPVQTLDRAAQREVCAAAQSERPERQRSLVSGRS